VAPFPGRIGIRRVSPGALIVPNDPIVTLDDISIVKLDFQIPERNLSDIEVGQEITARTDAFPDRVFFGSVSLVDTRVDRVTRAVSARALIPNDDRALKPGMFLLVELGVDERLNTVLIPEQAVVSDGTSNYVYVVIDGQAIRRPITIGERMPGEVEILDGVISGEAVIVGGVQKVRDGAKVAPRQADHAAVND
jgi:membrane fusion protein (multidrug efflux system)